MSDFIRSPHYGVEKIVRYNQMWLALAQDNPAMLTINYEEMQKDTIGAISRIAKFLGFEIPETAIRKTVAENVFSKMQEKERTGAFAEKYGTRLTPRNRWDTSTYKVRRGIVGGYTDELSREDILYANEVLSSLGWKTG